MNRKDLELIARAIKSLYGDVTPFAIERMAVKLCREIKPHTANFDAEKFLKQCGIK